MANTSDGKGDPPDPPNAHMNTDALPSDSFPVPSAKQDSIPIDIDQDLHDNHHSDDDQHQYDDDMEFYDTDTEDTHNRTTPAPRKDITIAGSDVSTTCSPLLLIAQMIPIP